MRIFRNIIKNKIKVYNSLDSLKILTFWNIVKDKNSLLLDSNYFEGKKYSKNQLNEIESTWLKLYDEYYVLLDDSKSKFKMDKTFNELKLRDKINQLKNNVDYLELLKGYVGILPYEDIIKYEQETYSRVKIIDKRIKIKLFDGINPNLEVLNRAINSLINKYNSEHKTNKEQVVKEISNVYDVVASAESWMERNLNINDMVVSHWIAIQKQILQKQKAQQKNGK